MSAEFNSELIANINDLADGYSLLQQLKLSKQADSAEAVLAFDQERGDNFRPQQAYRFCFSGIQAVACWTMNEKLPQALLEVRQPDAEFMGFLASLFREQFIYEWSLFAMPGLPSNQKKATWKYTLNENYAQCPQAYFLLERPQARVSWTLGLWFQTLNIKDRTQSMKLDTFYHTINQ